MYSYDATNANTLAIALKITEGATVIVDTVESGDIIGSGTIPNGDAIKIQLIATSTDSNGHNMGLIVFKNGDIVFDLEAGGTFGDPGLEYDDTATNGDIFIISTTVS